MTTCTRLLPMLAAVLATSARAADAQHIDAAPLTHGTLSFDASATLGAFTGSTETVTGHLDSAASLADARGWVATQAQSLTSHNGHRDRDMGTSLDIEHYPTIRFDLDSVRPGRSDGDSIAAVLRGRFTIHGRTRSDSMSGWIWLRPDSTRFRGSTRVDVKNYDVGGLSKMLGVLKMNQWITVRADVVFGR